MMPRVRPAVNPGHACQQHVKGMAKPVPNDPPLPGGVFFSLLRRAPDLLLLWLVLFTPVAGCRLFPAISRKFLGAGRGAGSGAMPSEEERATIRGVGEVPTSVPGGRGHGAVEVSDERRHPPHKTTTTPGWMTMTSHVARWCCLAYVGVASKGWCRVVDVCRYGHGVGGVTGLAALDMAL